MRNRLWYSISSQIKEKQIISFLKYNVGKITDDAVGHNAAAANNDDNDNNKINMPLLYTQCCILRHITTYSNNIAEADLLYVASLQDLDDYGSP